jgi:hypothetical protein
MRPKQPGTYYIRLDEVLEGDYIRAGNGFKGPMYMSKVIAIEYTSDTTIRVLTERGEYFGNPQSTPAVICREFNPRDKFSK